MKREWAVLLIAMAYPSVMTWVYFVALGGTAERSMALQIGYVTEKIVQFSIPVLYVACVDPRLLRPRPPTARGLTFGIGFALVVVLGMAGLYYGGVRTLLREAGTPEHIYLKLREFDVATPTRFVLYALFLSVIHALLEEYFWRWFVFGRLRRLLPFAAAVTLASVSFMAHHVIVLAVYFPGVGPCFAAVLPFSLCVAVGGAVWAWLYEKTGSFYAPWVSHVLIDAAIMAVAYDLIWGPA